MMQAELDVLPDVTPSVASERQVIDGREVMVPVLVGFTGALFTEDDDGLVQCQRTGDLWMVGRLDGRRVKRRHPD